MSEQFVSKMMFAVLCSVLVSSAFAAETTTPSPDTLFFARYDTNPKDGIISNAEFHKAAYTYDTNGDGNITGVEFTTLYHARLGVTEHEADETFYAIDLNHDGTFDDKEISTVYNVFDGNGDGQMTPNEFLPGIIRVLYSHGGGR